MGFRTVVITKHCKCSYKNDYLIIRDEEIKMIHLSEIEVVIFETPAISVTGVLLCELAKHKIGVIFCDEKHLPIIQSVPFSCNYQSSARKLTQSEWCQSGKDDTWQEIVRAKIEKQGEVLLSIGAENESMLLYEYVNDVSPGDKTNREGFAAKVYFNALFGADFVRHERMDPNACLDYGYSILLSITMREIVKYGYEPAIGIHHKGPFNPYNLACDIMEPFRPLVDKLIYNKNQKYVLNLETKKELWNIPNLTVMYNGIKSYLPNVIGMYFRDACASIERNKLVLQRYSILW